MAVLGIGIDLSRSMPRNWIFNVVTDLLDMAGDNEYIVGAFSSTAYIASGPESNPEKILRIIELIPFSPGTPDPYPLVRELVEFAALERLPLRGILLLWSMPKKPRSPCYYASSLALSSMVKLAVLTPRPYPPRWAYSYTRECDNNIVFYYRKSKEKLREIINFFLE